MAKIKEIKARSIITKSGLPGADFVVNPYIGCAHACLYCYARFMKRFTGHDEPWGDFVDVKINAPDLIPKNFDKYRNKNIVIGSVTDPYQRAEEKHKITRQVLQKLINWPCSFDIITKSALVVRDIDIFKKFPNLNVALSLAFTDDIIREGLEPGADSIDRRISALKALHENRIRTTVFISPIFPILSDWKKIIRLTKKYANGYWFENLNIYPSVRDNIYAFFKKNRPELIGRYREIYKDSRTYWRGIEREIENFCQKEKTAYRIFFHHSDIKKVK